MEGNYQKICPKCKKEYPKDIINCEKCNITLMKKSTYNKKTKEEIRAIKNRTNVNIVRKRNANRKSNIILEIIITLLLFCFIYGLISILTLLSEPNVYTCARCNKTFTDSANTKSIARTNFCVKCYDDYKFASEVREQLKEWE